MKKIFAFSAVFLCFSITIFSQSSSVKNNYYAAEALLNLAIKQYQPQYNRTYQLSFVGKEYVSGHFATPLQLDTCALKATVLAGEGDKFTAGFDMLYAGTPYTSKYFFQHDSCDYLDYGDTAVSVQSARNHALVYFYSPYNVLLSIEKNKSTLHLLSGTNKTFDILGFNDQYGNKFYVYFNKLSNLFTKLLQPAYDDISGDYYEEIDYEHYKRFDGFNFPARIVHRKGSLSYRDISVISASRMQGVDEKNSTALNNPISMDTISADLFLLKLTSLENKVLVSKNNNYLSVFEAPVNLSVCRDILAFLKNKFPGYPVKYCFLSHHHPDHAGGVAAFMEIGATIVTTEGNIPYFMQLYRARHTLLPDIKDTRMPARPLFEKVNHNASKKYGDRQCPVEIYEGGDMTYHTKEYLFFYFPKEKALFVGDLVLFLKNGVYPQGERALAVYKLITGKKLAVDKIYTSWPLHNFKDYGTMEDLKACLQGKIP